MSIKKSLCQVRVYVGRSAKSSQEDLLGVKADKDRERERERERESKNVVLFARFDDDDDICNENFKQ